MKMNLLKQTLLSVVLLAGTPLLAKAESVPQQRTQAPGYYRMMLGQFEITALSDGTVTIPLDKLLTHISHEEMLHLLAQKNLQPQAETSINAYLINTGKQLILVDTGAGPLFGKLGGKLPDNLRAAGYPPEKIDTVLLTHIHADHSGGVSRDGKLVFPNATVYVNQKDADFWLNPANSDHVRDSEKHTFGQSEDSLQPVLAANRLKTFAGKQRLFPGITAVPAPGHTPGHSLYQIESDGQKLTLWGDTIHAEAVQFPRPLTTIDFDRNMDEAAEARLQILAEAARNNEWIGAAHISFPGLGQVKAVYDANGKPNGYRWLPANYSMAGLKN
ncbi:MBL fold metallo-hydrolase [Pectobacterium versatile]|uniref:MBL fold metallo-hydrolase n=1 Tax=Pectobacterium versatile TaxID=2488639 RepID=UPI000F64CCEA|nr:MULTISPECIES: MBL fold metallo-hydrolase [Pectobacterium]AZK64021.1 MBL fold metallo-hydrolase [Pectobacterium versatile]MCL6338294.1 MBL fold metallo-hydrolase [Pectobacterium carotovorum subsp. carotovorum]MCL6342199.1 MBL fold metallo-hydrolase [Pectobacterium carotovorum subsp. carotovorum]